MLKRFGLLGLLLIGLSLAGFAPPLQTAPAGVTLAVSAGFDGSFRENQWMPVFIRASNDGPDVEGNLVVRPETSNNAVGNTFSVPISLPQGARKAVFLYITANSFASQIRIELINNEGVVITAEPATIRSLQPRDQLAVVISQSPSGTVDLTGVHDGGYSGFQANWLIDNIPDRAAALAPIDTLMFSDIDTGTLSSTQRQAITEWVTTGGHLIITGGGNWQSTAAGLTDLLPLVPDSSTTTENLTPIADWLRFRDDDPLAAQTVIATGTLDTSAQTLVKTSEDVPLLARRVIGDGAVDYLAANPNDLPLRGWGGLTNLWLTMATSVDARPSWSYGITSWEDASNSVNVLPGVNLLPDILPLCGFLAAYIALIGPLNYLVLNRINRREWAWLTIPIFIVVFSALAWAVGFNLRGNDVTLSRLTVVQTWPDTDQAQTQQLIGLLSPRRAQYTISVDGAFISPVPYQNLGGSNLLTGNIQTKANIQQTDQFRAANVPVDSSFIAGFSANAVTAKPSVGGQASLAYNDEGLQVIRGSVRNDSDVTLNDPVIMVRGQILRLETALEPGDVETFSMTLSGQGLPNPAPLAYAPGGYASYYRYSTYLSRISQNIQDVLGLAFDAQNYYTYYQPVNSSPAEQETYRRRLFLSSFMNDSYNVLTGRGNHAYLAGWTSISPLDIALTDATWKTLDTTLYLIQLDVEIVPPTGEVLVSADQFTWMVESNSNQGDIAPMEIALQPGDDITFRYTPLPSAVLREVTELHVLTDRGNTTARSLPIQIWNWNTNQWEEKTVPNGQDLAIRSPADYLGPQNAVQIRIVADAASGYSRIQNIIVEQRGQF